LICRFPCRLLADCTDGIFQAADAVAEIGYADDSLIVCTFLNRFHEVFSEDCPSRKISWPEISFGPKKKARQPEYGKDNGAFLPIAPSYFKV
jgi:hypothetical protein